ncbi:MAG TPA: heavy metal translocating P-type ATPase [Flavobacteriaceae bacterium]|nr:heavy metal translocating P-type ATPase [Flavobacteriaceae bacterium]
MSKHQSTCCKPTEKKIFNIKKNLAFAILSGVFLLSAFLIERLSQTTFIVYFSIYAISYFFGAYYTVINSWETLKEKRFDIDFLMLVAAIGAASLEKFAEGGLLLFLFSLGHALESYAMDKASQSISALSELTPKTALLKKNGETKEVPIEDLQIGDIIVAKPHNKIAADGVVIQGESAVDQSPITGESIPVDKSPIDEQSSEEFDNVHTRHKVFAGSINGSEPLELRVLKLAEDSTLSKLVTLVQSAETQRAPAQVFADKFSSIFVPAVLFLVGLLFFAFLVIDETFKESFYRAMAVLVAASPCALAISTPSAVLAGIARAAKGGVLIKGGLPLQEMAKINAIAFDKTGTLTTGIPKLTHVIPYAEHTEDELLQKAVAVESLIDHPLAKAIVNDGKKKLEGQGIPEAMNLESLNARGVRASIDQKTIYIGNRGLMREVTETSIPKDLEDRLVELENQGHTAMIVLEEKNYIGIVAVQDTAREEAAQSIANLKSKADMKEILMLTGDNQRVADTIAEEVGIKDAFGDLLPEDKVTAIEKKKKNYQIAMIGDGINDAPAMASSNLGVSMGAAGSDVALETAEVALLGDSIRNLPFAFLMAKQSARVIKQNLFISIGVMAILVPLTILGLSIGPAVIIHEGSTLLVVANALRLLGYKSKV